MTPLPDEKDIWPDRLMIRDTRLHDDMGGAGQRIYTTAGQGYEKREYVRADLAKPGGNKSPVTGARMICFHEGCQFETSQTEAKRLRARITELETALSSVKRNIETSLKAIR